MLRCLCGSSELLLYLRLMFVCTWSHQQIYICRDSYPTAQRSTATWFGYLVRRPTSLTPIYANLFVQIYLCESKVSWMRYFAISKHYHGCFFRTTKAAISKRSYCGVLSTTRAKEDRCMCIICAIRIVCSYCLHVFSVHTSRSHCPERMAIPAGSVCSFSSRVDIVVNNVVDNVVDSEVNIAVTDIV